MFDKSTRTLMAMLFERGAISEIEGRLDEVSCWTVTHRTKNQWRDDDYYDGWVTGAPYTADFRGDTVDEVLDKLEAYLQQEAAA